MEVGRKIVGGRVILPFCEKTSSDDVAGGVYRNVGGAEGGDGALAASVGGAEGDEENLVFGRENGVTELGFHLDFLGGGEVALEDGELEMITEVFADIEDAAEALVVADVVGDKVAMAHLEVRSWKLDCRGGGLFLGFGGF